MTRDYDKPGITVHWDSSRCIHTARCLRALPSVFDVQRRPWVDVEGGTAEQIAEAVMRCPTGALKFSSDIITERVPAETELRPQRGGPLFVRGSFEILDADGNVVCRENRVALCRCGNSGNQPFCDNSHRTTGFTEPALRARDEAAAPDEVCPPQEGLQ